MVRYWRFLGIYLLSMALIGLYMHKHHWSYLAIDTNFQLLPKNSGWKLNERTHIYELDGKPPLWFYWDNKDNRSQMPPQICLALKSLHCHNHQHFTIRILNSELIHTYIPHVHPIFSYLIPAHRADYARGRILEMFGGMYLDIDAIALQPLTQWFDLLANDGYDIVGYSWLPDGDKIGIGTLGPVRANHSLFQNYTIAVHQKMDAKLNLTREKNRDLFRWTEILRKIVVPKFHDLLKKNQTKSLMYNGPSTVGQLAGIRFPLLSHDENCTGVQRLNLSMPYLIYKNSGLGTLDGTDAELLESKTLLGCLYRIALKDCETHSNGLISREIPSCQDLKMLYTKPGN